MGRPKDIGSKRRPDYDRDRDPPMRDEDDRPRSPRRWRMPDRDELADEGKWNDPDPEREPDGPPRSDDEGRRDEGSWRGPDRE